MNLKKLLSILLMTFPLVVFGQSYVFHPEIETKERQDLTNTNVTIVYKDSRVFAKDIKEKCTRTEIFTEFSKLIQDTYPSAKINILNENEFNIPPTNGIMTIKINLLKYDVTFYTGMWIANTKYEVQIYDFTNVKNVFNDTILGEGKQFNALGNSSGKTASNSSFKRAFDEFLLLIDKVSQSTNTQLNQNTKTENSKSKAERLRELKQLLDEKVLTQEEFDVEKRKILDE